MQRMSQSIPLHPVARTPVNPPTISNGNEATRGIPGNTNSSQKAMSSEIPKHDPEFPGNPNVWHTILFTLLEIFGTTAAIIFGVRTIKAYNAAATANDLSNESVSAAMKANDIFLVANQLPLIALFLGNPVKICFVRV